MPRRSAQCGGEKELESVPLDAERRATKKFAFTFGSRSFGGLHPTLALRPTHPVSMSPFMPYLIDLHCHSWFSGDGVSSPEALLVAAKRRGLHGFAITDHNTCDAYHYYVDQGYARRDGQPVNGFLILPGVEVSTAEGHLLCLGTVLPDMKGRPAAEVAQAARAGGGIAIPAHPYDRFRAGIREKVLDTLEMDALEVFNAAISVSKYNVQAREYAERRGLPMIAASDAHHEASIGTSHVIADTEDFTVRGVLAAIKAGVRRHEQLLSFRDKLRKTLNNWFRLRGKRTYQPKPPV
jgi:predicted metal-dependent phosphoesterase TrpH